MTKTRGAETSPPIGGLCKYSKFYIMEEQKKGWGGAREGSGRKKKMGRNFNFRATPEVEAILDSVEGSKTEYINAAVLEYSRRHPEI